MDVQTNQANLANLASQANQTTAPRIIRNPNLKRNQESVNIYEKVNISSELLLFFSIIYANSDETKFELPFLFTNDLIKFKLCLIVFAAKLSYDLSDCLILFESIYLFIVFI